MAFVAHIEGLAELQKSLSGKNIRKQLALSLGEASIHLHSTLRSAIRQHYDFPVTLDSVQLSKSKSRQVSGKNLIQVGLSYKFEAIPLYRFGTQVTRVSANTKFIIQAKKSAYVVDKDYAEVTKVRVVRKRGYKLARSKSGKLGFLLHRGNSSKWKSIQSAGKITTGKDYPRGIYARLTNRTWKGSPKTNFLDREPIQRLYGPSLTQMAANMYDSDPGVQVAKANLVNIIAENIKL